MYYTGGNLSVLGARSCTEAYINHSSALHWLNMCASHPSSVYSAHCTGTQIQPRATQNKCVLSVARPIAAAAASADDDAIAR